METLVDIMTGINETGMAIIGTIEAVIGNVMISSSFTGIAIGKMTADTIEGTAGDNFIIR